LASSTDPGWFTCFAFRTEGHLILCLESLRAQFGNSVEYTRRRYLSKQDVAEWFGPRHVPSVTPPR
jgi:hypothetical protein